MAGVGRVNCLWLFLACCLLLCPHGSCAKGNESLAEGDHGVRLFVIQSDEHDLIDDWLNYHSHLFGANNIHVIDMKSTDAGVVETLAQWEVKSVRVERLPNATFSDKHLILSKAMRSRVAGDPGARFLLPMDMDEFIILAVPPPATFSTDRSAILAKFGELQTDGFKFKFRQYNAGFCGDRLSESGRRAVDVQHIVGGGTCCTSKTFYYAPTFVATDQGNHQGKSTADSKCASSNTTNLPCPPAHCYHRTDLGSLHFGHHTAMTYEAWERKMLRGFTAYYGAVPDRLDQVDCTRKLGTHYCRAYNGMKQLGRTKSKAKFQAGAQLSKCGDGTFRPALAETLLSLWPASSNITQTRVVT
jgi:hypothetical protein